jgi:DNA-binding transcriptional LysR family regulator
MDLWQLNVFCKVVEAKSFSKAGQKIHLSQPTVSSHIKDLETYFDTRLIDRFSRKAEPTPAGKLLYEYARRLIILKEEMENSLGEFLGTKKGSLAIGGSTIPGGYLLPKFIGDFTRSHPQIHIRLEIADTEKIIQDILDGRLELGIVGARSDQGSIVQQKLVEDEMHLIVPRGHKWYKRNEITMEELYTEPFIVREKGSGTLKSLMLSMEKKGHQIHKLKTVAIMGSTEAVRQGIKNHVGVSILSTIAVADDVRTGDLKMLEIKGLELKRCFYLTRHKNRTPSPPSLAFEKCLVKKIAPGKFYNSK